MMIHFPLFKQSKAKQTKETIQFPLLCSNDAKNEKKNNQQKISSLACVVFKNKQQTLVENKKITRSKTHTHNCNGYT